MDLDVSTLTLALPLEHPDSCWISAMQPVASTVQSIWHAQHNESAPEPESGSDESKSGADRSDARASTGADAESSTNAAPEPDSVTKRGCSTLTPVEAGRCHRCHARAAHSRRSSSSQQLITLERGTPARSRVCESDVREVELVDRMRIAVEGTDAAHRRARCYLAVTPCPVCSKRGTRILL